MLVLSRRKQEKIVLPDYGVTITVLDTGSNRVRIGIDAPPEICILRSELPRDFRPRSKSTGANILQIADSSPKVCPSIP